MINIVLCSYTGKCANIIIGNRINTFFNQILVSQEFKTFFIFAPGEKAPFAPLERGRTIRTMAYGLKRKLIQCCYDI